MSSSFHVLHEKFIVSCVPSSYFTVHYLHGLLLISLNGTEGKWKDSFQNIKLLQFEKKLHCSSPLLRTGPKVMCSNCRKGDKTAEEPLLRLINYLMNSRCFQCIYARMQQDWDRPLCSAGSARS